MKTVPDFVSFYSLELDNQIVSTRKLIYRSIFIKLKFFS